MTIGVLGALAPPAKLVAYALPTMAVLAGVAVMATFALAPPHRGSAGAEEEPLTVAEPLASLPGTPVWEGANPGYPGNPAGKCKLRPKPDRPAGSPRGV